MEHRRSRVGWIARWQDRREAKHTEQFSCHWNRESLEMVKAAGLDVMRAQRHFFGIFHEMILLASARPAHRRLTTADRRTIGGKSSPGLHQSYRQHEPTL